MSDDASEPRAVPYSEEYLEHSWRWLHDPELAALTMTPPFSRESQKPWFRGLASRTDYIIWGLEVDGRPAGAFGIKNIRDGIGEYWGYIGEKALWGRRIGRWIMAFVTREAAARGLRRLELRVSTANPRAIRLYQSDGYTLVRSTETEHFMEREIG